MSGLFLGTKVTNSYSTNMCLDEMEECKGITISFVSATQAYKKKVVKSCVVFLKVQCTHCMYEK